MQIRRISTLALIALLSAVAPALAGATIYDEVNESYEAIRLLLLHDSTDGVSAHAAKLATVIGDAAESFDAARSGVPAGSSAKVRELLPALAESAAAVRDASTLAATRDAFFALSQQLAKYRNLVKSPSTVVVYCPMAEKAWIQPDGEIGNPYHGQEMPRCGRVVSK